MKADLEIWLERLVSLHKSQMRKAASAVGLQLVHLEILQYLSICNPHSNTAKDLCDYLGQTKGSISQSIKFIEDAGAIERKPCPKDGRVTRLYLTAQGNATLKEANKGMFSRLAQNDSTTDAIKSLLLTWQSEGEAKGFGQCKSCKYNQVIDNKTFHCQLLNEPLSSANAQQICKEHVFPQTEAKVK